MKIKRTLEKTIRDKILSGDKIIIVYGARQVGKTTMINSILDTLNDTLNLKICKVSGDEKKYVDILSGRDLERMKLLATGYDLLFIDEAQRIKDIGINLKLLHDAFPRLRIIATGSSSFELANSTKEPLTGRTWTYSLFPFSYDELSAHFTPLEVYSRLEELLVYGMYPELHHYSNMQEKEHYLHELSSSYLYRDILELTHIKHSDRLYDLLRLLAFQIGSEVSYHEIGQKLSMSKETVASYIDLLEKSFVIFKLQAYSKNLRKEISRMHKIYFWDTGIRNILINNLNLLNVRNDVGQLWENFIIAERLKYNSNRMYYANSFFWRVYTGAELDYVEEKNNELHGYEIKYNSKKQTRPHTWLDNYSEASFAVINRDNYRDFISE